MSPNEDRSKSSVALAIQLGIAKEGEPMTPLMSMLTTMKEYAEHVDIGAYGDTQASWASCIPAAEKLLELERKALGELRAKAAEWDSKLLNRTGELAELDARLERMTQDTARANEELVDATRKQSEATMQLRMTLENTRIAQENNAKEERRLKEKEDLLTTYSDDLEKQKASAASREALVKHRSDELEARESKMAATQRLARDSDTQAKMHLDAIRNAHSTLWMLTNKTGPPITGLSAHDLVADLQGLTSDIQDQIAKLNDSRTKAEEEQIKACQISNRELKALRDDVVAKASMLKKAELCAADYKSKHESLQATSSKRIQELELSNQNLSIATNSLEGRLSGALQHHTEMATEYAKYKALERTGKALTNQIQYIEGRLHTVEHQRNDAIAANRTFEIENVRLQKFEHAHRLDEEDIGQYIRDRDGELSELRAEIEASKTEARRLEKHCEELRSQGVTNAKNAATNIERVQGASNAKILELEETIKRQEDVISRIAKASDTKILDLEKSVKLQEEQLNDVEKLAKEQEDKLRKADDLNTSLYQKIKDGASAMDSAIKCRIEHQNFDKLKRRSSELEAQVENSRRARKEEREANSQIIKALRSQKTTSETEVKRLDRVISENRAINSQTIKALEGRIAHFGDQVKELESEKAKDRETRAEDRETNSQLFKTLEGENTQLRNQIKDLESEKAEDQETNSQRVKALEGRIAQLGNQVKDLESEKAEDRETNSQTIEVLEGRIAQLGDQIKDLESEKAEDQETNSRRVKALEGRIAQLGNQVKELEFEKAEDRKTDSRTIEVLEGRIAQLGNQVKELEFEKAEDRETNTQTIEALRSQNADSQTEVERLSLSISEYKETNSETIKGLEGQFAQFKTKIMELESEKGEATERATTADRTLRTYHDTIKRLRSERDQARDEIASANATYAAAPDELESLQQRMTPSNSNGQRASNQPRRKRRAEEMLEEDRPIVPAVGHAYELQEIRNPNFTDPNIPSRVLEKLHSQFDRWDKKSGQEWSGQITKTRCVEARQAKVSAQQLHGVEHACNYCEDRGRICVVVRQAGIITLLPVHQDDEAVAPEEESYWTK